MVAQQIGTADHQCSIPACIRSAFVTARRVSDHVIANVVWQCVPSSNILQLSVPISCCPSTVEKIPALN